MAKAREEPTGSTALVRRCQRCVEGWAYSQEQLVMAALMDAEQEECLLGK